MIVAIVRSRLNESTRDEYQVMAKRMSELAPKIPGYITHKGFVAEDGERLTVVEYESESAMRAWAVHPEHVEAKKAGRTTLFTDYRVQICTVTRDSADRNRGKSA